MINPTSTSLTINTRVRIKPDDGICRYLHGHIGTVEEQWDDRLVVHFDEPLPQAHEHWPPMEVLQVPLVDADRFLSIESQNA